ASPQSGFKTVAELIAFAKANPGKLNFASNGVGSGAHMSAVKFHLKTGIQAEHIAFKGAPETLTEAMAGRVDYVCAPIASALPVIQDRRVVALAVGTATRTRFLPELPTLAEVGVPGADYILWVGMLAPARTAPERIDRLYAAVGEALKSPELVERL